MLQSEGVNWQGALDDVEFLQPIYDLDALPRPNSRFKTAGRISGSTASTIRPIGPRIGSIRTHVSSFLRGQTQPFLSFIERMASPMVRPDAQQAAKLAARISRELEGPV